MMDISQNVASLDLNPAVEISDHSYHYTGDNPYVEIRALREEKEALKAEVKALKDQLRLKDRQLQHYKYEYHLQR